MTDTNCNLEPIRIFIGSSVNNLIEQKVYCYTLKQHTQHPIDFNIIDGLNGCVTNLTTGEVKQLPADISQHIPGATAFSLARWAIPEWCDYQGKAIYCDSDQIAMDDIAELWNFDLEDSFCALVPIKAAKCHPHYVRHFLQDYLKAEDTYHLSSVVLMDCEKASAWSLDKLVRLIEDNAFTLEDLMQLTAPFRNYFNISLKTLPSEWNHLDIVCPDSKIVHFTNLSTQPWRYHHNVVSELWDSLFLEAYDKGEITRADIVQANKLGRLTVRHKVTSSLDKSVRGFVNRLWRVPVGAIVLFFRFFIELFLDIYKGSRAQARKLVKGY